MELIACYYAIGTVAVAFMALVDLYHPVFKAKVDMPTDIKVLHYFVTFLISLIVAPVLIYPCVNTLKGIEFRDALKVALFD